MKRVIRDAGWTVLREIPEVTPPLETDVRTAVGTLTLGNEARYHNRDTS